MQYTPTRNARYPTAFTIVSLVAIGALVALGMQFWGRPSPSSPAAGAVRGLIELVAVGGIIVFTLLSFGWLGHVGPALDSTRHRKANEWALNIATPRYVTEGAAYCSNEG